MYYVKGDKVSTEALLSIQRIQSALSMPSQRITSFRDVHP